MSQKIKNNNKDLKEISRHLGFALMAAAALAGLVEMPERPNKTALLIPAYAVNIEANDSHPARREKEEAGPHYTSYSAFQRTPSRTGRI